MFGIVFRRCVFVDVRACAPSQSCSVGFSPLLSVVRGAGTVSGKGTKSVDIAHFLAGRGMAEKAAIKIAGGAHLQKSSVSTIRTNYNGLVAILGSDSALEAIPRCHSLLETPPGTTSGAMEALEDILGADGAAEVIRKSPTILKAPGGTIKGAHLAWLNILGADVTVEVIHRNPAVLMALGTTIQGAHKAVVELLGAGGAAEAILQYPQMLRSPGDTIRGAAEALSAHLGKANMLLAVGNNPGLLRRPGDVIHQTAIAVKGLLGGSEATALLKEKPRLFGASATCIEENFKTLCSAFDRKRVLKAVCVRPILLYDLTTAEKAVKTGRMVC